MSFILDAIAKSERERQQQEIPDARILAMPVSDIRRPRPILPYLVTGTLVLTVIVLLIWAQTDGAPFSWFSQSENSSMEPIADNKTAVPDNTVSVTETADAENADTAGPLNQADDLGRAGSQTTRAKNAIPDPVPPPTGSVVSGNPRAGIKDQAPPRAQETQAGSPAGLESKTSQELTENRDGNSDTSIAVEPVTAQKPVDEAAKDNQSVIQPAAAPAPRKVFRLGDLPADVRRDLPSVAFTGHLYSSNVNVSYVMVDGGRSVIAGQQIVDDVFLHEVTPTGAIVDFRGFLIEIGILQNWSLK